MSRGDVYEPALTAAYARGAAGLVVDKFRVAARVVDALVIGGEPQGYAHWRDRRTGWYEAVRGHDVTVVQTKANRLALPVMGQALFSAHLVQRHLEVKSVGSVIVCTDDDPNLSERLRNERDFDLGVSIQAGARSNYIRPAKQPQFIERFVDSMYRGALVVRGFPINDHVADAVVFPRRRASDPAPANLAGEEVVVLHTATPLGMSVMGLAYFSARLAERAEPPPSKVTSLALCANAARDLAALFDVLRPSVDFVVMTSCA